MTARDIPLASYICPGSLRGDTPILSRGYPVLSGGTPILSVRFPYLTPILFKGYLYPGWGLPLEGRWEQRLRVPFARRDLRPETVVPLPLERIWDQKIGKEPGTRDCGTSPPIAHK